LQENQINSNPKPSITRRFSFNLLSTLIGIAVRLTTNSLLPKALGPNSYGNYGYLISIYESIVYFFRTGIYQAYFNYNSKNENSYYINRWFITYAILVSCLLFTFTILSVTFMKDTFWNGIKVLDIYIVLLLIIAIEIQSEINNYGHSKSLTIPIQNIKIYFLIVQVLVVSTLFYLSKLNIYSFSITLISSHITFSLFAIRIFRKQKVIGILPEKLMDNPYSDLSKEIYSFSYPLITLALVTSSAMFFDRWFLQNTFGAVDQGFFHFADRLSVSILIFNGAIIPIMQKEFVGLSQDLIKLKKKYEKFLLIFFFISNFLIFCILFNINILIDVLLNEQYKSAYYVILIVVIGTVFRSLGQFQSILLISINKTKIIRDVGLWMLFLGFIFTFILLVPKEKSFGMGFGLGAMGLAIKFLLLEILSATIMYLYINKHLKFTRYLFFKLFRISTFLFFLMYIVKSCIQTIFYSLGINGDLFLGLVNIITFSILVSTFIIKFPILVGFDKLDLSSFYKNYIKK